MAKGTVCSVRNLFSRILVLSSLADTDEGVLRDSVGGVRPACRSSLPASGIRKRLRVSAPGSFRLISQSKSARRARDGMCGCGLQCFRPLQLEIRIRNPSALALLERPLRQARPSGSRLPPFWSQLQGLAYHMAPA